MNGKLSVSITIHSDTLGFWMLLQGNQTVFHIINNKAARITKTIKHLNVCDAGFEQNTVSWIAQLFNPLTTNVPII